MSRLALIAGALALLGLAALAQSTDDADATSENGMLANLLQTQLSGPGRQITLSEVSGLLSSQATIGRITVSDDIGPWLEITNSEIDWTRSALLLGRVNVNLLKAERIEWLRRPEVPPSPATLEARQPFTLPELPVAINLRAIEVGTLEIDENALGEATRLGIRGSFTLADGALDADLEVNRQDAPGGALTLAAAYANDQRELDLNVQLQEPQGGLVAGLLGIEGEPAIDLRLSGAGPIDNVDVGFSLDAGGARIAGGSVALRGRADGLGFDADISGELSPLVPAEYRDFFAGETMLSVSGVSKTGGGLRLDEVDIEAAALTLRGDLETTQDFFPRRFSLVGSLGDPQGPPVTLPAPGAATTLNSAEIYMSYGAGERWDGYAALDRLRVGDIEMEDVTFTLGGLAQNLDDPAVRNVTISVEGVATGVRAPAAVIDSAVGDRIDLFVDVALPPGAPMDVHQVQIAGAGVTLFATGAVDELAFDGRIAATVADLGAFSGMVDRPIRGSIDLRAEGGADPRTGAFDLRLDGTAEDLALGEPRLDAVLAGRSVLGGRAVRDATGIRVDGLRFETPQIRFASDGRISTSGTDIGFNAALEDLATIDPRLAGRVAAIGSAKGVGRDIDVRLTAAVAEGSLAGRPLESLELDAKGRLAGLDFSGGIAGSGSVDGQPVTLEAAVTIEGETRRIEGLVAGVGENRVSGDITARGTSAFDGRLTVDAPDIANLAALALVEASGSVQATLDLDSADGGQRIAIEGTASDLATAGAVLADLDIDFVVTDALTRPMANGRLAMSGLEAGGVAVSEATLDATPGDGESMDFSAVAILERGAAAEVAGSLDRTGPGLSVTLNTLSLAEGAQSAKLDAPATVTFADGAVTLSPTRLSIGEGSLTAQGEVSETLDLDLELAGLPLDIANVIAPRLGLEGEVNGSARVTGARTTPDVAFNVSGAGLASAATRSAGLPSVALDATGATADGRLELDAQVAASGGLASQISGSVPLDGSALDLVVDLQAFPLALVDQIAGRRGLQGAISGAATITGTLADPAADFSLRGAGISASVLRDNGVAPLGLEVSGGFGGGAIVIGTARLTNPQGLALDAQGRVPLVGDGLDVSLDGAAPLALADAALAFRDAQADGIMRVSATARGTLGAPLLDGSVTIDGGTLTDPATNLRLENVQLSAALRGDTVALERFSATTGGGTLDASGTVSLQGAAGNPADLRLNITDVRYTDGSFVTTEINGALTLTGPLQGGGGTISGRIRPRPDRDFGRRRPRRKRGGGARAGCARVPAPARCGDAAARRRWLTESAADLRTKRACARYPGERATPDLRPRPRSRCGARRRAHGPRHHHRHSARRPVRPAPRQARHSCPAHRFHLRFAQAGGGSRSGDLLRGADPLGRRDSDRHSFGPGL